MKGKNQYEVIGNVAKVYFRSGGFFICDADKFFELLADHTWHKDTRGYATASIRYKEVPAHIVLLGKQEGKEIDNKNRNKLDNRLENSRFVSHQENTQNRSANVKNETKCIGIRRSNNKKGYLAFIHVNKNTIYLGTFKSLEEAVRARKAAEAFYWGKQV